jgi:hypothetical protein
MVLSSRLCRARREVNTRAKHLSNHRGFAARGVKSLKHNRGFAARARARSYNDRGLAARGQTIFRGFAARGVKNLKHNRGFAARGAKLTRSRPCRARPLPRNICE